MVANKKILALIPARAGSKGLPGKNIKPIAGKPLIVWTIEEAKKSKYIDSLVVSTDGEAIADVARGHGCSVPFMRPVECATDQASGIDVVLHAIDMLPDFQYVLMLQPTSPLRTVSHIDGFLECFFKSSSPAAVSVTRAHKHPKWMFYKDDANRLQPVLLGEVPQNRQMLAPVYALNGALYVAGYEFIKQQKNFITHQTLAYAMEPEASVDIDTWLDFKFAEFLLKENIF